MGQRGWGIAVVVVLAIANVVLWTLIFTDTGTPAAGSSASLSSASSPSSPSSSPTPSSSPRPAPSVTLVLGDSFATPAGASSRARSWVSLACASLDWPPDVVTLASGAVGYTVSSGDVSCGSSFCASVPEQLSQAPAPRKVGMVVVSAGTYDASSSAAVTGPAIDSFFSSLASSFPRARIVATSPVGEPSFVGPQVRSAVRSVGGRYVAPGALPESQLSSDGVHPNDAGHAALADAVITALD